MRQAEGDLLGDIKSATTVEEAVEVDVDRIARRAVEENVLAVSVAESEKVQVSKDAQGGSSREGGNELRAHPRTNPTIEMTAAVRE